MRRGAIGRGLGWSLALSIVVAGCEELPAPEPSKPAPPVAPAASPRPQPIEQSDASREVARYYARRQSDLLTRGLLRTDGGGPDTPFDADSLTRDFEEIVFYDEYTGGIGTQSRAAGHLRRWTGPVRLDTAFGASVPSQQRRDDTMQINRFAARLGRITGHPISRAQVGANFHVLVMGEDDKAQLQHTIRKLAPSISADTLAFFSNMPLTIECSVLAFSSGDQPYGYTKAIAVIRAELPDLLRLSCIHEEIAQGLGPANDSPDARPSIFNDDDEFALLTNHDELLLKMLYDDRLKVGQTLDDARGAARIIARELMGQIF